MEIVGFSNCEYYISGIKKIKKGEKNIKIEGMNWYLVGDYYLRFISEECGSVEWLDLKIITKKLLADKQKKANKTMHS